MREQIVTSEVLPGLTLATMRTPLVGSMSIAASTLGGLRHAGGRFLTPSLAARMLKEGTRSHDKVTLNEILDSEGIRIGFSVDSARTELAGKIPTKKLPVAIELIAEMLHEPAGTEENYELLRGRMLTELKESNEDTEARAEEVARRAIFTPDHPQYSHTLAESTAELSNTNLLDLQSFQERYARSTMFVVAVGDVDHEQLALLLKKEFARFGEGTLSIAQDKKFKRLRGREIVTMPGKANVDLVIAAGLAPDIYSREFFALATGVAILGGHDFSARLMREVREKKGLTYGVFSTLEGLYYGDSGFLQVHGIFAPTLWQQGEKLILTMLRDWVEKGVSKQELQERQRIITNKYVVELSTSTALRGQIMALLEQGRGLEFIDEYPKIVASLSTKEVNEALRKHVDPTKVLLVAAGAIDGKGNPLK